MRLPCLLFLCVAVLTPTAMAAPQSGDVKILTDLLTVAASRVERAEVLSAEDMRNLLELEANKVSAGCADDGSCLAELAGALGARLVVFGQLGQLDDELVLTLSLFDAETARATAREVVRAPSASGIGSQLDDVIPPMIEKALGPAVEEATGTSRETRPKVLVMDISLADPNQHAEAPAMEVEADGLPLLNVVLLSAGGITAVAGSGVLVVGAVAGLAAQSAHEQLVQSAVPQVEAPSALQARDESALIANVAFVVGGAAIALGLGAVVAGLFFEETP